MSDKPKIMTQDEFNVLLRKTFARQSRLAANSNFVIKGFDQHTYGTLLQAFAEELGLIEIKKAEVPA